MKRASVSVLMILGCLAATGCVRRTITITSDPSGALCHLNGREVGRTPVEVDFLFYGTYDVVLEKEGFEPLLTSGKAEAPLWDSIPFDLVSEMSPGERESKIEWHYALTPRNDDPQALIDRARELRDRLPASAAATQPASQPASQPAATQPAATQSAASGK